MNTSLLLLALLGSDAPAAKILSCETARVEGLRVTAEVDSDTLLTEMKLTGAFQGEAPPFVMAKETIDGKILKFIGLQDGWCWYNLIVSTEIHLSTQVAPFEARLDRICEDGAGQAKIPIRCEISN